MASVLRGSGDSSFGGNLSIEGVLTYEDVTSVDSVGVITARSGIDVGTGTSIFSPSSNELALGTTSEERLRIDSSGRLLVGATSSVSGGGGDLLEVASGVGNILITSTNSSRVVDQACGQLRFWGKAGANEELARIAAVADGTHGAGDKPTRLVFSTSADGASSPTERLRIDSSGRLLVGDTSVFSNANADDLQIGNTSTINVGLTIGSSTQGQIAFADAGDSRAGLIHYQHTDNSMRFYTAGVTNEQMRITSGGIVKILGTSESLRLEPPSGTSYIGFWDGTTTAHYGFVGAANKIITGGSSSDLAVRSQANLIFSAGGSTERMRIASDGSIFAYNLSGSASAGAALKLINNEIYRDTSSIQFKKDVEDIEEFYATNLLENARPAWFRAKEDENPEHSYYGFIAEELAEVEPRLCVFEDGEPFSVDYAKFTPLLLKLLQMQNAHIKSLETKLETLEQRLTDAGL